MKYRVFTLPRPPVRQVPPSTQHRLGSIVTISSEVLHAKKAVKDAGETYYPRVLGCRTNPSCPGYRKIHLAPLIGDFEGVLDFP
jgi:hypothetical protein